MATTVKVYARTAPTTVLSEVADASEKRWLDPLNDYGSWSFTLDNTDADMVHMAYGNIVRFFVDGIARFAGVIEAKNPQTVAPGEESDERTTISGRGLMAVWEDAVVYPEGGLAFNRSTKRRMDWTSAAYDDTAWGLAVPGKKQSSTASPWDGAPEHWPDPDAYWIWGILGTGNVAVGECFFRGRFTTTEAQTVAVFASADDGIDVYIDAQHVVGETRAFLWGETKRGDMWLEAGDHIISIRGENILRPYGNSPAGVICSVYKLNEGGQSLGPLIIRTDGNWKAEPYPAQTPGLTIGRALRVLKDEAQIRGTLANITFTFTDTVDSWNDPWLERADILLDVGRPMDQVLREYGEVGCEYRFDPENHRLDAFRRREVNRTQPGIEVELKLGRTIKALSHPGRRGDQLNFVLGNTPEAWIVADDTGSIIARGRREGFVNFSDAASADQARRLAQTIVDERKDPQTSYVVEWDPDAEPSDDVMPYLDFDVGDRILAPSETKAVTAVRVHSISYSEDDEGNALWRAELNTILYGVEQRAQRWLQRSSPGTLGGSVETAGTSAPTAAAARVYDGVAVGLMVIFSWPGVVGTRRSGSYKFREAKTISTVGITAGVVGTTDTTITLYKNGSSIGTAQLPASDDDQDVAFAHSFAIGDRLAIAATTPGTNLADAVVQVF